MRNNAYSVQVTAAIARTELYKLLSDAGKLRLLALTENDELTVTELSELTGESQPQVSKRVAPLKKAALIATRKEGTRTYLKAALTDDPVLADALTEGRRIAQQDGTFDRLPKVLAAREAAGQAFFASANNDNVELNAAPAGAQTFALASLLPAQKLAVDLGAGDGTFLDVLAPAYERVFAVDRSPARLTQCAQRITQRGFSNVRLMQGAFDDIDVVRTVDEAGGADLVTLSRTLHHAARPGAAVADAARLLKPGGHLLIVDYRPHTDESRRDMGDVWLGFADDELARFAADAGLAPLRHAPVPTHLFADEEDAHLPWTLFLAVRPNPNDRRVPVTIPASA